MNNFRKSFALAAAAMSFVVVGATSSKAATFDFVSIADDPADANYIGSTELNWGDTAFSGGLTIDGITLIASGSNADGEFADAFFDMNNRGLGVCSTVVGSAASGCAGIPQSQRVGWHRTWDGSVGNVFNGETLTLDFGQIVDFTAISLVAKDRSLLTGEVGLNGGTLTLDNGVVTGGANLLTGASIFNFQFTGDTFFMQSATVDAASVTPSSTRSISPVPLPAGGLLVLTGLGALGFAGRRRRKAVDA